jgi:hypothetical protein
MSLFFKFLLVLRRYCTENRACDVTVVTSAQVHGYVRQMGEFRFASEMSLQSEISQDMRYNLNPEYI